MADDTQTVVPIVNGAGTVLTFLATVDGSNRYTLQSTPRINGAQIDFSNPIPTKPAPLTLVPLAVAIVTTGGVAVTALSAGQRTAGGWIQNASPSQNLGINEIGTATGTTSSGSTTFITPGQTYILAPSNNAVSVISADSAHPFSGMGWQ